MLRTFISKQREMRENCAKWYYKINFSTQLLPFKLRSGASQVELVVKNVPADAGDAGSIPGLGRSPEGDDNPLQCSCLENPMDRGAWWTTVLAAAKESEVAEAA